VRRLAAIAAAVVIAAGVAPGATDVAMAEANHEIELSAPPSAAPGQPLLIRLNGTTATVEEYWDPSYIEVVAIPTDVIRECPADAQSAGAVAEGTGRILAIAMRPAVDAAGNFVNSVGFTAGSSGAVLFCGYLYNDVGYTYAWAWSTLFIGGAGGPGAGGPSRGGAAAPANVTRPLVTRSGRQLICHPGAWTDATGYRYRWRFDGRRSPVTGRYATLTGRVRGHEVSCQVTASGPGGRSTASSRTVRL
jgi:hypothetical protein